jgi:hypothetical protein
MYRLRGGYAIYCPGMFQAFAPPHTFSIFGDMGDLEQIGFLDK